MNRKSAIFNIIFILALAAFAALELANIDFFGDQKLSGMFKSILTRGIGGILAIMLMKRLGYGRLLSVSGKPFRRPFLLTLPCLLVCVNNFPFIGLFTGNARVTSGAGFVALFALECISVGLFEEAVFRGIIFPIFLEKARGEREIFKAVLFSSAVFGGVHLFNVFAGAGIAPTLLQVGYSFLMGGMWAVSLLHYGHIWPCAAMHAIYNFGGMLIPNHGEGLVWDAWTVVITAVLGTAVGAYVLFYLFKKAAARIANEEQGII